MAEANWYALWVRSRQEFVTDAELGRKGIEHFLPTVTKVRAWKDRNKSVVFPLFPGYLFVRVPSRSDAFLQVVQTRGAVTLVALVPGFPTPVSPEEIISLKSMLGSGSPVELYPDLQTGAAVRGKRGPLCGAVGMLSRRNDQHRFTVNIELLGRSVSTSILAEDVEQA